MQIYNIAKLWENSYQVGPSIIYNYIYASSRKLFFCKQLGDLRKLDLYTQIIF